MYHTLHVSMLLFLAIDPGEGRNVLVKTVEKQSETENIVPDLETTTPGIIRSRNKALAGRAQTRSTTSEEFYCYECDFPDEHNPYKIRGRGNGGKERPTDTYYCTCTTKNFDTKSWDVFAHDMDNCYDCEGGEGPGRPGLWLCTICCPCPGNSQRGFQSHIRDGFCRNNPSSMMYYTNDGRGHTMNGCKDHHHNQTAYDNLPVVPWSSRAKRLSRARNG